MALSVKVALGTCLGFIFGMSWLVSQVARPMVDTPTPLVVRGPDAGPGAVLVAQVDARPHRRSALTAVAGRFARSSPLEVNNKANRRDDEGTLLVAEALPRGSALEDALLAPPYVPEAPVIAKVDEPGREPTVLPGAGKSVMTITSIPEAIVADAPARGARVLAALVSRAEPVETAIGGQPESTSGQVARGAKKYKVKRGDTLVKIMRREWQSDDPGLLEVLLAANPEVAKRRDRIFPGEVLHIPVVESSGRGSAVARTTARLESGQAGKLGERAGKAKVRWYTIRKRDSLASIARRLLNDEARWRDIAQLNGLPDAHKILPGTRIKLPPAASRDT